MLKQSRAWQASTFADEQKDLGNQNPIQEKYIQIQKVVILEAFPCFCQEKTSVSEALHLITGVEKNKERICYTFRTLWQKKAHIHTHINSCPFEKALK